MARAPFGGMTEGGSDYGYQYQMPRSERPVRKAPERFSLAEFGREVVTGFVMGGLSSAAFYGAGRAVEAVKSSVRSGCEGGSDVVHIPGDAEENPIPLNKQTVNGQDIPLPDPAAEGRPHTALGGKVSSETGGIYEFLYRKLNK